PTCVAYSPDGSLLAVGSDQHGDHTLKLWDLRTGEERGPFWCNAQMKAIHFSPDGQWLATAGQYYNSVRIWSTASLREGPRLADPSGRGNFSDGHRFSPDSRYVAGLRVGKPNYSLVWEVLTGEVTYQFPCQPGGIMSVAFAADGRTLFTGGA